MNIVSLSLFSGVSIMIRMSGILLGTFMNNLGLKLYINPFLTPTIQYTDPRWIGAWWFTPAVLGVLFLIPALLLSRFPDHMDVNDERGNVIAISEDPENPAIGIPLLVMGGSNKEEKDDKEEKEEEKDEDEDLKKDPEPTPVEKASLKDMWISFKRLANNKLFVYIILGYLARRFGHLPFNTYMVKYMEQLFNVPTADAK